MPPALLLLAFFIDQIIGDPIAIPHPVVIMGKVIAYFEKTFNHGNSQTRHFWGIILTISLAVGSFALTWSLSLLTDILS